MQTKPGQTPFPGIVCDTKGERQEKKYRKKNASLSEVSVALRTSHPFLLQGNVTSAVLFSLHSSLQAGPACFSHRTSRAGRILTTKCHLEASLQIFQVLYAEIKIAYEVTPSSHCVSEEHSSEPPASPAVRLTPTRGHQCPTAGTPREPWQSSRSPFSCRTAAPLTSLIHLTILPHSEEPELPI